MIDVGAVWGTDVDEANKRSKILKEANIIWLEEPFFLMLFLNTIN